MLPITSIKCISLSFNPCIKHDDPNYNGNSERIHCEQVDRVATLPGLISKSEIEINEPKTKLIP